MGGARALARLHLDAWLPLRRVYCADIKHDESQPIFRPFVPPAHRYMTAKRGAPLSLKLEQKKKKTGSIFKPVPANFYVYRFGRNCTKRRLKFNLKLPMKMSRVSFYLL